jgi:hypothetical protein
MDVWNLNRGAVRQRRQPYSLMKTTTKVPEHSRPATQLKYGL